MSRLALARDRVRDLLIAAAVAWALAMLLWFATGSREAGNVVILWAWLPLFVICRIASAERDRRESATP